MHGTAEDVQGALCGGCDPNSGTGLGITPLMVAFQRDDLRMVKALVRAGGDPTSVDGRGRMCIDYAHGARFVCRPF
jgi:ankyrin repeat protein